MKETRVSRWTFVVAAVVCAAAAPLPTLAQGNSVAFGFGLGQSVGGGGDCPIDDCNPLTKSIFGEGSALVTDSLAVVGRGGFGWGSIDTTVLGVDLGLDASSISVEGGVRAYGGDAGAFFEVLGGIARQSANVTVAGLRLDDEGELTAAGIGLSAGPGIDIGTGERTAIRVQGSWSMVRVEGETAHGFGAAVGLVLRIGG